MGIFWIFMFIWVGFALMRFGKKMQREQIEEWNRLARAEKEMIDSALEYLDKAQAETMGNLEFLKPLPDEERAESVLEDFKTMLYG